MIIQCIKNKRLRNKPGILLQGGKSGSLDPRIPIDPLHPIDPIRSRWISGSAFPLVLLLISSQFSYKIPIESRRILRLPTVGSDVRQLPVGIRCQGFRQVPTGFCRKLSDYLGFPVGSDGIRVLDSSTWVRYKRDRSISISALILI